MASQAYRDWLAAGRPVSGLIRPMAKLRDRLRTHGYTVYDVGNVEHMQHQPPEDHTPFSATGWPTVSPRWWLHAIDIMPPAAGRGLPSLQQLGAQMLTDRKAGHAGMAWLKYMNWEPDRDNGGACYQERFTPSYERRSSGDRGHIHQSGRTDMRDYSGADDYDPVARVRAPAGREANDVGTLDGVQAEQLGNLEKLRQALTAGDTHVRGVYVWTPDGGRHEDQPIGLYAAVAARIALVQPAPIDVSTLKAALLDPEVRAVLAEAARAGAEAAEDS